MGPRPNKKPNVAHAQTNKEGETCANKLRRVCQQLDLDRLGAVLQSNNDPSFNSEVFQAVVREFGLKHVFSKTYSSTSQGKVERTQLTLRSMIGKWRTASGRGDWHTVLPNLVHSYNATEHSVTKVEPAIALAGGLRGDADLLAFVRHNNFKASKKLMLMGVDGKHLQVGDRVRVSIFAISSQARREREKRKASEQANWSRAIFTVKNRSAGTELAFPSYRLREFGNSAIFYRYELLGPIDESRLRKDVAKPPAKDNMKELEDNAVAELTAATAAVLPPSSMKKPTNKEDARFVGMRVRKEFVDAGSVDGIVVGHVPAVEADLSDEKWIVQYTNGKQEALDPQTLLDIMVVAPIKGGGTTDKDDDDKVASTKEDTNTSKKNKADDPLIGRQVGNAEDEDVGEIIEVRWRKYGGKKRKRAVVKWGTPLEKADGTLTYTKEYFASDLTPLLLPQTTTTTVKNEMGE